MVRPITPVQRHTRDRPGPDERPRDTERFNNQNAPIDVPFSRWCGSLLVCTFWTVEALPGITLIP